MKGEQFMFIPKKNLITKEEKYKEIIKYTPVLFQDCPDAISNLSNASALLHAYFNEFNWVGFYLYKEGYLVLGPFQGLPACTRIEMGDGVCGLCAQIGSVIIVNNVNEFPNHISCDANSQSEIVVPIFVNEKLYGVLDIDSPTLSCFNDTDKNYLTEFIRLFQTYLS